MFIILLHSTVFNSKFFHMCSTCLMHHLLCSLLIIKSNFGRSCIGNISYLKSLMINVHPCDILISPPPPPPNITHDIFNSSPPGQNGRHFADDIFKRLFLDGNIWILNTISLKYVPWDARNNMSALVQIMAWRRPGDKPLSEPMLIQFTDAYMRH